VNFQTLEMPQETRPPVSVTATYWIGDSSKDDDPVEQKTFNKENATPARIGLPDGVSPSKVRVRNQLSMKIKQDLVIRFLEKKGEHHSASFSYFVLSN
jgi:hypothetical protein